MQGILYEEPSVWQFFFVTMVIGGWTAWRTGRAVARTWGSFRTLIFYLLLLGLVVRFIHHALFEGTMTSVQYYLCDTAVLMIIGLIGFRYTRTKQMVTQYHWLYEKTGPFGWRERPAGSGEPI